MSVSNCNTAFPQFLLILITACVLSGCYSQQEQIPTYRSYNLFLHPKEETREQLKSAFDRLAQPLLKTVVVYDSGWVFVKGGLSEELKVDVPKRNGELLHLPHRILLPDQSLWYSQQLFIPLRGFLHIKADDGAQLFVNDKQINRITENYFPIAPGKADISIRVLNNAMAGGLNAVTFIDEQEMKRYKNDYNAYLRLKRVIEKAVLINAISNDQLEKVKRAVSGLDTVAIHIAELAFEDYPYLVGPWLLKTNNDFRLMVQTTSDHEVTLHYGSSPNQLDQRQTGRDGILSFEIKKGIENELFYRFTSSKTISPIYHFKTREQKKFSFNVWADSQGGWQNFQTNINNAQQEEDAFGIGAGDLVNNGSDREEWLSFFNVLSTSSPYRPYYLIPGNHDHDGYYDDLTPQLYHEYTHYFSPGYFSWTYSNCAFIALNPNLSFPIGVAKNTEQRKWFEKQIQSDQWKKATWRFVLLHQAIYSQGWEGYHGDQVLRDLIEPVIESANIDFVISGHTHDYERLMKHYGQQRTTYLIVGGAGGSLEPSASSDYPKMDTVVKRHHMVRFKVEGNQIYFKAFDINNSQIDSLTIRK